MLVRSYSRYSRITWREGHGTTGKLFPQDLSEPKLVRRVRVAVEQTHGHGINPEPQEPLPHRASPALVERRENLPLERDPLADLENTLARNETDRLCIREVVHGLAIGASQLVHVAEAGCGDDCDAGAAAGEQSVDAKCRPMDEEVDGREFSVCLRESVEDAARRIRRHRLDLLESQRAALLVEHDHVCERASYVNRDAHRATL